MANDGILQKRYFSSIRGGYSNSVLSSYSGGCGDFVKMSSVRSDPEPNVWNRPQWEAEKKYQAQRAIGGILQHIVERVKDHQ